MRWTTVIISTLSLTAVACARNPDVQTESANGDVSLTDGSVAVTVKNNNYSNMDVYAIVDGGEAIRLGTVTGLSSSTLLARPSMFSTGTLRLTASPIGGGGVGRSGPLSVSSGQTVTFTIESSLALSFGVVR